MLDDCKGDPTVPLELVGNLGLNVIRTVLAPLVRLADPDIIGGVHCRASRCFEIQVEAIRSCEARAIWRIENYLNTNGYSCGCRGYDASSLRPTVDYTPLSSALPRNVYVAAERGDTERLADRIMFTFSRDYSVSRN